MLGAGSYQIDAGGVESGDTRILGVHQGDEDDWS